jgi:hypothetical protein
MPLRANLVASARRHLPCQPYAYTRMRGDTIVSLELTQIGINTGAQIRFVFVMELTLTQSTIVCARWQRTTMSTLCLAPAGGNVQPSKHHKKAPHAGKLPSR